MDEEISSHYKAHRQFEMDRGNDDGSGDLLVAHNVRKNTGVQNARKRNKSPAESKGGSSKEENDQSALEENDADNVGFLVCTGETSANRHNVDKTVRRSEVLTHEKEYKQLVARNLQLQSELHNLREVIRIQEHAISWYLQHPKIQSIAAALFPCDTEKDVK